MWVPFQAGFTVELGLRLQGHGYGDQPFDVAIGSSSGSLVAAAAAAGGLDHDRIREALVAFAKDTRFRPTPGRPLNPYPQALRRVFDHGLIDTARAATSRTHLVVTASHYDPEAWPAWKDAWKDMGRVGLSALLSGTLRFLNGDSPSPSGTQDQDDLLKGVERLIETGGRLVTPRYFSNRPVGPELAQGKDWRAASTPEALRFAVEASARIPGLYGGPARDGADALIDGAFADNAPVGLALDLGAKSVFVVTSSRSGNVFDRPFQSLAKRNARATLERLKKASDLLARIQEKIPIPASLDLEELGRRHPHQRIHVVHPNIPIRVNRFLESDPGVLGELYEMGREAARHVLIPVPRSRRAPGSAA